VKGGGPEIDRTELAWHLKKYSADPVVAEAEDQARRAKRGLWSMPNPEYHRGSTVVCIAGGGRPDLPALPYLSGTPKLAASIFPNLLSARGHQKMEV
jgi:hypothetical protein